MRGPTSQLLALCVAATLALGASACGGPTAQPDVRGPTPVSSGSTAPDTPSALGAAGTIAVHDAVFAAPAGTFLCSLSDGTADCTWPAHLDGIHVPSTVCGPAANQGTELRPGQAPGWLCATDVGVLPTASTTAWAPATLPRATSLGEPATPELVPGLSLTSDGTRCTGVPHGVRCSGPGGWFALAPGHLSTGRTG